MKKILLPALLLILLSGCSHKGEVRSMSFVKTIGTDFTEDGIQNISLRLYDSENTLTGNGRTIFSAIEPPRKNHFSAVTPNCLFQGKAIFRKIWSF